MSNPDVNVSEDIEILNKIKWDFVPSILDVGIFFRAKDHGDDQSIRSGSDNSSVISFGVGKQIV